MKMSLFERAITCCLLGAGTFAVASGMKLTAHTTDGAGGSIARSDGDDDGDSDGQEEASSADDERDAEEGMDNGNNEETMAKLVAEIHKATGAAKEEKRDALKNALADVFRKRTQMQRTRIEGMKEKLEAIESQLERRSNLEEQIVQRRLAELLGDKDELSWDHDTAIDVDGLGKSEGAKHLWGRAFGFEFPGAFDAERSDWRSSLGHQIDPQVREQLLLAKKQAEQAERAAVDAARHLRDARNSDAKLLEKTAAERVRFADEGQTRWREMRNNFERKLPELDVLQKSFEGKQTLLGQLKGKDGEMDALREMLEAMQSQSKLIEKQLDELAKKKAEAAKTPRK